MRDTEVDYWGVRGLLEKLMPWTDRQTGRQGQESFKEGSGLHTRARQHASVSRVRNQSPHSKSGVPSL